MIAILEKYEHNVNFHQIVDFVEASHIRYALTINPTVYVSHIRHFWSTVRIETTNEGTKILATVDSKLRTIFASLIRRNLKLNDEEGISTLLDAELFENLALMGYNIFPNQKFTFQKGQFSYQWKYLIHTIMQCLSPKSIGFNEFRSNIATAVGEGSGTPTEPHHTPSPEVQQSPHTTPSSPSLPPASTDIIPTSTPTEILILSGTGQSKHKTSTLPHDSTPRVTSLATDEGSMQQQLNELTDLCTRLQRQQTEMATKIATQDVEISNLKARIKMLEDKDGGGAEPFGEDAKIKERSLETGKEAGVEKSTKRGSNDIEELLNVFTYLDVANILISRVQVVSVPPTVEVSIVSVPIGSGVVPNVAREMEEQLAREDQRRDEQIARDAEIARIHAEEELQMLIDGLDRNNEMIAKYLQEYKQFAADLSIGEKIDMINELVKYQDHYAKVLKYQSQQSKPGMTLEEIREKFIPVWKQIEDFVPMASKEEGERFKRKWLRLEHDSAKNMKTSEEVSEEDLKAMMQLVQVEEVYVEALQVWTLVKETLSIKQATSDKKKELWVELKRLYEPDVKDQLWTHTQALMHAPIEWRLYDSCAF
nr:hypothetical protein [Tanacetum cinerariifolium]